MKYELFSKSVIENLVLGFLYACGIGLLVAFITQPFMVLVDNVFLFFDKNALQFVSNLLDPFRVSLSAGFLGSFITILFFIILNYFARRHNENINK